MGSRKKSDAIRVALSIACASSLWSSNILLAEDLKRDSKVAKSDSAIVVANVAGKSQITIRTASTNPRYTVQRLKAPERLVIDLADAQQIPTSSGIKVSTLPHVSAVRVGAHPEKTRIVVDLKGGADLVHEAKGEGSSVVVSLSSPSTGAEIVKEAAKVSLPSVTTQPKAEPVAPKNTLAVAPVTLKEKPSAPPAVTSSKLALDEDVVISGSSNTTAPVVVAAKTQDKATLDTAKPAPVAVVNQPAVAAPANTEAQKIQAADKTQGADVLKTSLASPIERGGMLVTDLALDDAGGMMSPAVSIRLKGAPEYSMTRTAPSEYVVTLRNIKAAESLMKTPLFAPRSSSGIRSVRAVVEGSNVLVRIFTQPSSYLSARRIGDRLVIEETQDLSRISRDIRAQIDPAAAKQGAEAEEAKAKAQAQKEVEKKVEPKAEPKVEPPAAAKQVEKPAEKPAEKVAEKPAPVKSDRGVSRPDKESDLAALKSANANYTGRLISLDLQEADIDSALRIIAEVSNLNIVAGDGVSGKVTLKLVDVPWDQALEVILKSHGLDKVLEGNVMRVAPVDKLKAERESFKEARVAEEELEPLSVKYMRVSYAKASEIKALVETVLSERGTVAFDERSNQLVVKDVSKGLQNVSELIKKVDLRTPQILLETQIVEASRNLSRQLGSELGFQYIQSPATGNGTGLNFPSAIALGGSADTANPASILGSAFPVATSATGGSAVTMLFDSADGTKSLSLRLSQLEQEGRVRIVSKPAVATTNNKPAEIKSVEKVRIRLPNGGLSIASGSGATSSGSGDVAAQTIEAGIILNVTPQASPDYYILLDIKAKSSSFSAEKTEGIPNEIERSASSSVLVSSGQTFALGGIYKLRESDSVEGVPFFKDIPVLGTFFRSLTTQNSDEELLFFITPRIVEGSFEDASMRAEAVGRPVKRS